MASLIYTDEQFALFTSDGRDLLTAWVAIELDAFRDGSWTVVDVGAVAGYERGEDGACLQPLREIIEWDIPADLSNRIRLQILHRYRAQIDEWVWDRTRAPAAPVPANRIREMA